MTDAARLTFQSVDFNYGDRSALRNVSFALPAGITGLLGVNGAGKTTLLRLAVGDLKPTSGVVQATASVGTTSAIGYCPQAVTLPGALRVHEFLEYLGWLRGIPSRELTKAANTAIEWADLTDRRHAKLGTLSGGMARRVVLAQALLGDPQIILLDEPTTGLDPEQRSRVRKLLESLPNSASVLMSSHIIEDLTVLAPRVLILDGGEIRREIDTSGLTSDNLESMFLKTISRNS